MRTVFLISALALACGGATREPSPEALSDPSPMEGPDPSPRVDDDRSPLQPDDPSPGDEPDVEPPPAPADDPSPMDGPDNEPDPATDPEPGNPPEDPQPDPVPTPEDPDVTECVPGADCDSCRAGLDPDLAADGSQLCLVRECADASECSDLGDGLVCLQRATPQGPMGRAHCRLPLLDEGDRCAVDESVTPPDEWQCETGLTCRVRTGQLRCSPYEG